MKKITTKQIREIKKALLDEGYSANIWTASAKEVLELAGIAYETGDFAKMRDCDRFATVDNRLVFEV